ncbi:Glutamate carboxypeptidase 2 [Bulinus truncatus]|nr:Glutamate carboxypeptidase 2 [Bulinus truncatus]
MTASKKRNGRVCATVYLSAAAVLGLAIGLLVGTFAICKQNDQKEVVKEKFQELVKEENEEVSRLILERIDPKTIETYLSQLTERPHIAGKSGDFDLVKLIRTHFEQYGLHVQTTPYEALLSYPSEATPNSVRLLDGRGRVVYDARLNESDISGLPDVVPPFHAYSPSGLLQGQLVFVNYGRVEDYDVLHQHGVNVTGHIVIVKYGKIFRGNKVDIAAANGAVGVIIYSDPADYTSLTDPRVYPDTWWLPPDAAQRGTVYMGNGDPLTPGYPANDVAFRHSEDDLDPPLPQIPSHPIGYGAATEILKHMKGLVIPAWRGGLNVSYSIGPGFQSPNMTIQLNVTSRNQMGLVENVFGIIKGTVEPDRYILIGNHRDAWIYGAIDPSSGTAVIMELARVMGTLVKNGEWKPRRSVVFCSWGAEEYALVGSNEWVEQYVTTLRERTVGYINIDLALEGNDTLAVDSTPLMMNVINEATKKVPNPNPEEIKAGRKTVYDTWQHLNPTAPKTLISNLGSGSDYASILQVAGITSIDLRYMFDQNKYSVSSYPLYHTEYETLQFVKTQMDRDFKFHAAVAGVAGEMTRSMTDSLILPFKVSNYATGLEALREILDKDYGALLRQNVSSYPKLATVIQNFTRDVHDFELRLLNVDRTNPYAIRTINDQIMLLERAFLSTDGLPLRPLKKHLIFADNSNDGYAGVSFPGLVDLLFKIDGHPERWDKVRQHFAAILQTIQSAGATLRDVTGFMSEEL